VRLRRRTARPRIIYIQYTNPAAYPPLENSSGLLAECGWDVLFLGVSVQGAEGLRFPPRLAVANRQLPAWTEHVPGALRYLLYAVWILTWVVRWRPDWIYASDLLACPPALVLSYVPGLRVVYHEHDAPSATGMTRRSRAMLGIRRLLARRATIRILPNELRTRHFARTVADKSPTFSVWNCPRRIDVARTRDAAQTGQLRILYQGTLVPARLPITVLEALALLPEGVRLVVVGYETGGHRGYRTELMDAAVRLGLRKRVDIHAELPHAEVLALGKTCDVGLALLPSSPVDENLRWMPGASNKVFEYLADGLPVLVSDLPGWREIVVDTGYGLACAAEEPRSIASAISWWLAHPEEMRAMGERGRARIAADWNYETQFAPVLERLRASVA
jgi:glycosyltransferase involved in cell wall biosynthesis